MDVIALTATLAQSTTRQALDELALGHVEQQHMTHAPSSRGQHGVETRRLLDRAREPIEQEALDSVGLRETVADDADDDLVRDQRPGVHGLLGRQAHLRALSNGGTEHVSRGDVRQLKARADARRLCPLAGAGGAQKDDVEL